MSEEIIWEVPPGNTKWQISWSAEAEELFGCYDVPDDRAAVLTQIMLKFTSVEHPNDLMAGPIEVNEDLSGLLRDVVPIFIDLSRFDYWLEVVQDPKDRDA